MSQFGLTAGNPHAGFPAGPTPGNFGIGGPTVPYTEWMPRGSTVNQTSPAAWANYGQPPVTQGSISLKSVDFLQHTYLCPPINDGVGQKLMPDMPVFALRAADQDEDTTIVMSIAKINKLMLEEWEEFLRDAEPVAGQPPSDAQKFQRYLSTYGERGLEDFAYRRSHASTSVDPANNKEHLKADAEADLEDFFTLATSNGFCYLTRYGILQKLNWLGIVINTNRAIGLETEDDTDMRDHYTQINVGLGKRLRCANVWGSAHEITTGSNVWIKLTRRFCPGEKAKKNYNFGAFQLVPGGSRERSHPLARETMYYDEAGMLCQGHVWRVGVVIEPGEQDPSAAARENANGTGHIINKHVAYEAHGSLPTLYLAVGFNH